MQIFVKTLTGEFVLCAQRGAGWQPAGLVYRSAADRCRAHWLQCSGLLPRGAGSLMLGSDLACRQDHHLGGGVQ